MYNFNALLSRMKYIPRWGLMRQSLNEDVAQHTSEVMIIAHTLSAIANKIYNKNIDSEKVVLACLYHDMSEILTGDMPTPVKYFDDNIKNTYKQIEQHATSRLLSTLSDELSEEIKPFALQTNLTKEEKKIIKAADKLSALVKCIEELRSGNGEFKSAYASLIKTLEELNLEEVNYFIKNMIPAYSLSLDELCKI